MAFVKMLDGKCTTLAPDRALQLWEILIGNREGTEKQQAFAARVERLFLNWSQAPASYREKYPRNHLSQPTAPEAESYWNK